MANHKKIASALFNKSNSVFLIASLLCSTAINYSAIAQADLFYNKDLTSTAITSLMSATIDNDIDGVTFFVKSESSTISKKNIGGATALHLACRNKNFEIAKILVENGADVNAFDNEGWTPLMRASLSGDATIVGLLLDNGANVGAINNFKDSTIIHAAISDCNDCLGAIFEKSAIVRDTDIEALKQQIHDAFVIARNHDNRDAQTLLSNALDDIIRFSSPIGKEAIVVDEVQPEAEGNLKAASLVPITLKNDEEGDIILNDEVNLDEKIKSSVKNKNDEEIFKENNVVIIDESKDSNESNIEEEISSKSENKDIAKTKNEDKIVEIKKDDKTEVVIENIASEDNKNKEILESNSSSISNPKLNKKDDKDLKPFIENKIETKQLSNANIGLTKEEIKPKKIKFKFSQGPMSIQPKELNISEPQTIKEDPEIIPDKVIQEQPKKSIFSSLFSFFNKNDDNFVKEKTNVEETKENILSSENEGKDINDDKKPGFFNRLFSNNSDEKNSLSIEENSTSEIEENHIIEKIDNQETINDEKVLIDNKSNVTDENEKPANENSNQKKLGFFSRLFNSLFSKENYNSTKNEEIKLEKPKKFKLSVGEQGIDKNKKY